ncbi:MAG: hypothetical protein OXR73_27330 [Myxococcales bacterium]|nr:hypothetical protein [Myxococcales bacterium]
MERAPLRPLFGLELPVAPAPLLAEIRAGVAADNSRHVGTVMKRHVELTVRARDRHFWSPHLSLDVFEGAHGTRLRGRYAPHPSIWTFIMALYGVLTIVAMAGIVYGLSQWNLGWTPWALAAVPASAALVVATWLISMLGQRLARPQMEEMHTFLEDCVTRASNPPPAT